MVNKFTQVCFARLVIIEVNFAFRKNSLKLHDFCFLWKLQKLQKLQNFWNVTKDGIIIICSFLKIRWSQITEVLSLECAKLLMYALLQQITYRSTITYRTIFSLYVTLRNYRSLLKMVISSRSNFCVVIFKKTVMWE